MNEYTYIYIYIVFFFNIFQEHDKLEQILRADVPDQGIGYREEGTRNREQGTRKEYGYRE